MVGITRVPQARPTPPPTLCAKIPNAFSPLVALVAPTPVAPEPVFLLFLAPLLYISAFYASVRDFRAHARPMLSLAIGLVAATTVVVAAVIHTAVPGLGWAVAFTLGAIVSPPDAVAATRARTRRKPGAGRHVDGADECTGREAHAALQKNGYKFSTLVTEIVKSVPFRQRRARDVR